ncbi:MAG TPA: acyl-CoA dehydrogenase family protein [Polyangia bacterium]|nr:acyl-CoA dehydrogenase family protein [Polyangia bacterium]
MRPFTDERHDEVRAAAVALAGSLAPDAPAREIAAALARAELLELAVPHASDGAPTLSPLAIAVAREALAADAPHADAILAVQALSSLPIAWGGSESTRARWLPGLERGEEIGAFALTERASGSDAAALEATARRDGDGYRLDGEKVLVSGARDATVLVVFARTGDAGAKRAISAFAVPRDTRGLVVEDTPVLGGHAVATVRLDGARVPVGARLGEEGEGLSLALRGLETMRPTVGAAACGVAARAIDEARAVVCARRRGGEMLAEHEGVRLTLATLATELDAARLLVYRAAWLRETTPPGTRLDAEAAMAKWYPTEACGRIVDAALQLHGGAGLAAGATIERLYRHARALRIYEGTTEIQKLIIARAIL